MSNNNDDPAPEKTYTVGYGKPPVRTRFKPGRSGNSKGRRKNSVSLKSALERELLATVRIHEGDRELLLTRLQALIKSMVARAIKGDHRASQQMLTLVDRLFGVGEGSGQNMAEQRAEDKEILEALFKSVKNESVKA